MNVKSNVPSIYEDFEGNKLMWDIYSRQLSDRIIWLGTPVNDFVANVIVEQLLFLDTKSNKDIKLYINSPGGSVTAGLAIYDTMNYIGCDVSTICVGQACSMGAFLLSAGAKGKRFVLPNSEVMIHQPLGGYSGQASDIAIHAEHILKLKAKLNGMMAKHTGQLLETLRLDTERDNFMSAQEAVDYGLADVVISERVKEEEEE